MDLQTVLAHSADVVAREIEGQFIIIPITAGVAHGDDELYTLNDIGLAIWRRINGRSTLAEIRDVLLQEFDAEANELQEDMLGFVQELYDRRILVDA